MLGKDFTGKPTPDIRVYLFLVFPPTLHKVRQILTTIMLDSWPWEYYMRTSLTCSASPSSQGYSLLHPTWGFMEHNVFHLPLVGHLRLNFAKISTNLGIKDIRLLMAVAKDIQLVVFILYLDLEFIHQRSASIHRHLYFPCFVYHAR